MNCEDAISSKETMHTCVESTISPTIIRSLVADYVIKDMLSLSTVQSEAFRKLIVGVSLISFT